MKSLFLAVTLSLFAACGPSPEPSVWTGPLDATGRPLPVPASWSSVDSECHFTFRAPADMRKQDVQGIDSCVGLYKNTTLALNYDYGGYSDPLLYSTKPDYQETPVLIDGQSGQLIKFRKEAGFVVAVHFPSLGDGVKLTAWVDCQDASAADTARLLISTIDFK